MRSSKPIIMYLVLVLCFFAIGLMNNIEAHYTREVTVVEVQDQEVTVEDKQGHQWCFFGEDYTVDQEITVVMYNNHTSQITDDEIVRVK